MARAHSATHLLHHALHQQVGRHAEQQGSKVEADRLRFDFNNPKAIPDETLVAIEQDVSQLISASEPIIWETVPLDQARQAGAMMLFGEKYPDPCRMVSMGTYSRELCGGTHLQNTSDVQTFEIVVEESVSTGTRRIEALTGSRAIEHREQTRQLLNEVAKSLQCEPSHALASSVELMDQVRSLKKALASGKAGDHPAEYTYSLEGESVDLSDYYSVRNAVRELTRRLNVSIDDVCPRLNAMLEEYKRLVTEISQSTAGGKLSIDELLGQSEKIGDTTLLVVETPGANPNVMRGWIDQIRKQSDGETAIFFAAVQSSRVILVAGVSRELVKRGCHAGNWVGDAAKLVGGGGGGRPDMAQAGGKDASQVPSALAAAKDWMRAQLSG